MADDLLEQVDNWAEAYEAMSGACKSLMAGLSRIKALAERTDALPGDMLYEIVCEVEATLEDAPRWGDPVVIEDDGEIENYLAYTWSWKHGR